MFILDTNVLSELMRDQPADQVGEWVASQPFDQLFTVAVCQAEILAGLAVLPEGKRRAAFEEAANAMFDQDFAGRILPFDSSASVEYAAIVAIRRRLGRPIGMIDLIIASVARSYSASVVTRDSGGFKDVGLTLINPWG